MNHHTRTIHERFLRHIWNRQYLKTKLETQEKKSLQVIQVGQPNRDSGPDFLNAKIKIAGVTYSGDVEIHRTIFDWLQHRHQEDPRYNKVILHVVLEPFTAGPITICQSGRAIPVLVLGSFLSESIYSVWQKVILDERMSKLHTIPCFKNNHSVSVDVILQWLSKLAFERIELKLRRFEERLKQLAHEKRMTVRERSHSYGEPLFEGNLDEIPPPLPELTQIDLSKKGLWDQILYEGILEGLGYSKNRKPFLNLASSLMLEKFTKWKIEKDDETIEALVFGVAGLIPTISSIKDKDSRTYVRKLSHRWKKLKPTLHSEILHSADWQFFPTRPTNFPTLRLSAASAIIRKFLYEDFFRSIIQIIKSDDSGILKERRLIEIFQVESNEFWKHHYNFNESSSRSVTALGKQRIREILVNAVFPITLLYARTFKDIRVREETLCIYYAMQAFEDNSIVRFMKKQLVKERFPVNNLSTQQALIQLFKLYCSDSRCDLCQLQVAISMEDLNNKAYPV
jgi:hypothetical protein